MTNSRIAIWRRTPFKRALCAAYSDGIINSKQLHDLCDRFDRIPPPWLMDGNGWPIERFKGNPIKSFVRVIIQNFRKIKRLDH